MVYKTILLILLSITVNAQIMLNPKRATTLGGSGGGEPPSEEAEVTAWKSGLSLEDSTVTNINDFVVMLKDSFALDSLNEVWDIILVLANENPLASLHNLARRDFDADTADTATEPLVWTQWEGWHGERGGATGSGYIDMNYTPSSDVITPSVNDFSVSVFMREDYDGELLDGAAQVLSARGSVGVIDYSLNRDDHTMVNKLNDNTNGTLIYNFADYDSTLGLYTATRTGTTRNSYRNSTQLKTDAVAAATLADVEMKALISQAVGGAPANDSSPKQLSFIFVGTHLTLANNATLLNICKAYLAAIGKDVTTY